MDAIARYARVHGVERPASPAMRASAAHAISMIVKASAN
jgi:hypothetical protein